MNSWYERVILPRLVSYDMDDPALYETRAELLKNVRGTVLELGAGAGYNFPFYTDVEKVYALEPSAGLIELAKEEAAKVSFPVEFLQGHSESISLLDDSIQTVVSTWTLCSVDDIQQTLKEVARVLAPGGTFVFVEHGASPNHFRRVIQSIHTIFSKRFMGNCHYDRHIGRALHKAGFHIDELRCSDEPGSILIYNYEGVASAS